MIDAKNLRHHLDKYPNLPDKANRIEGWPVVCLRGWLKTFQRWNLEDQPREFSVGMIVAINHMLHYNFKYIQELEQELAKYENSNN